MRATRLVTALLVVGIISTVLSVPPADGTEGADGAGVRAGRDDTFVVHGADPGSNTDSADTGPDSGCDGECPRTILTPICAVDRWGNPPLPGTGECLEASNQCPDGQVGRLVWTEGPIGWVPGQERCVSEGAAVPVAVIAAAVVDRTRHRVPAIRPDRQPRHRALVGLPVILDSGQAGGQRMWTDEVAGFTVTTSVSPSWAWDFGDGHTLVTTTSGSRYPDLTVSHEYRTPGRRRIGLTTTWDGSFSIAGAGTFPIQGEVVQEAALEVVVVEARAVLVPSPTVDR